MNPLSALAVASSGLHASSLRSASAASNLANVFSTGYRRLSVSQSEAPGGGVSARLERSTSPGDDMLADLLSQVGAVYAFKVNLLSIKTADKMAGAVLSLRA